MNVAMRILARHGLKGLTVKKIADEIELTDAAIYKHFKSKEAILASILDDFAARFESIYRLILQSDHTAVEKLEMIFTEKCRRLAKYPAHTLIMRSMLEFRGARALNKRATVMLAGYKEQVIGVIQAGQRAGQILADPDPEHLYFLIIGGLHALVEKWEGSKRAFDLQSEGARLWFSIRSMITVEQPQP